MSSYDVFNIFWVLGEIPEISSGGCGGRNIYDKLEYINRNIVIKELQKMHPHFRIDLVSRRNKLDLAFEWWKDSGQREQLWTEQQ